MQSAIQVANWLKSRPAVKRVLYPALADDPGHALWRRDFTGAAALFSFVMNGAGERQATAFVNALELFGIGSSWGGYESLVTVAHAEKHRTATKWDPGGPTLRLHIGLEDPDDLVADLEHGFQALEKA